jgi:hypothetical protein
MIKKVLHFIQYNNATVLILVVILVVGSGAFAATDTGQELIGARDTRAEGIDNTLLINADLDTMDMDYNIERIEKDEKYYYVTYTYLDLRLINNAWQYQLQEDMRKVSLSLKDDLGEYLAEELFEQYEARVKDLKAAKEKALSEGETIREEVTEFSGLIGQTLALAGQVFPGYEPVKRRSIPSPSIPPSVLLSDNTVSVLNQSEELDNIYEEYVATYDPDGDDVFGILDNCPDVENPDQLDRDGDGLGDACDKYFNLTPEEYYDDTASGSEDVIGTTTDDVIATTTTDVATTSEIISVEIVDVDGEVATST